MMSVSVVNCMMYIFDRVLYGNQITELPPGVFAGLNQLQLLLVYLCMLAYWAVNLDLSMSFYQPSA